MSESTAVLTSKSLSFEKLFGYVKTYGLKALKLYAVFGVLNVVYKLYLVLYSKFRAKRIWKHLPGQDMDLLARRLAATAKEGRFHDYFASFGNEYPNAELIRCDTPNAVLVCNGARAIKWMLKDEFSNVTKPAGDDYLFELMKEFLGGKGIFVLQHGKTDPVANDFWHKERKVSSLIFTKANFESLFYDTFVEKAHKFIARLEKSNEQKIDLQELFFSFTMDSIEKFFLGTEVNTINGGMSEYARAFDKAHNSMMKIMINSVGYQIPARLLLPYPFGTLKPAHATRNTLLVQLVRHLSPMYQDFFKAIRHLDDHVRMYIKKTRADPNLKSRKDIIANFLNSSIGDEVTDDMLRDLVLNLTIAGRDTTACALSWLFFQLTQNPEVQQKLIEEIDIKLQGRVPTLADLEASEMPYLNGAIYETLRLHPPVPTESKLVTSDITYLDGTPVPKGTKLMFSAYSIGRNPTTYPDPLRFDPARWIPFNQPSLYEFPVFQAGPRFCLGKDMAQFEMKLLTCMLLQKFSFTLLAGEAEKISYTLMLTQSIANNADKSSSELWCFPHKRG